MLFSSILLMSLAQASSAAPAPTQASATADEVICRMQQEVHSRIPTRICRTAAQWEEISREAQEDLKKSTNQRHLPGN